ncbi:major facilitator superfamily domain-containing protein [Elsinoe ampelina]|uniref:Major facilitator superfamily domain-containing protein n=1 Tax=Elsinoe ampelina TaxID=302913 RepID=A0A6A6G138_9PEZI|nr:major facilitator superfamily domain-containing protein [Elsinoe ampelina]
MEKDTTTIGQSSDAGSPSPSKQEFGGIPETSKDQAFQFLTTHHATEEEVAAVDLKRLRRVIDWHIIPIMLLVYIIQFLDKVLLNYAAVMGISTDLKLKGNNFADVNTYTFLSILLAEFPTGFILNKVPAGKWLGINTVLWGVSTAVVAATKNYTGLLISRIFLGIFEAAVGPCLIIISSQWYTKSEQPARFGLWYCGVGIGQILGSLFSYGFQHVTGASLASWRIMFIVLGVITITIGVAAYFIIPDSPMTAKWMNDAEKSALLQHISVNMTGVVNKQFKPSQLVDFLTDPQMYLLTLMLLLLSVTSGVGTTFSATLLRNVGYNAKQSAVLNAPSGVVSIVAVLLGSFGVRYAKHRWAFIIAAAIPAALSGALMSFVNTKAGVLAGIWLINTNVAVMPIIYSWVAANMAGHTKRPLAMSTIVGAFSVGNIIGPQTFQARDAPQYLPAKITVLACVCAGGFMAFVLMCYYKWQNSRRDKKHGTGDAMVVGDDEKWANLTDRENKSFRYVT